MEKTAVVALGGNAITRPGQAGTHDEQLANVRAMADAVCRLRADGWSVVVVHGNGPQVGNLAIQQEEAEARVPALPLFLLGAMTEGHIGSLLTLALREAGGACGPQVVSVVTHVLVDGADPAFSHPTKPIGPFLDAGAAERHVAEQGWVVGEDAGRGYRRLVASPQPGEILELSAIRDLVATGALVIAAGGGGVPVVRAETGFRGVEAVIDKDLAAQRLATALGAEALVLVTDVPRLMLDYGTPHARGLGTVSLDEAQEHLDAGQFPDGSMGPKVRAALQFLREGGRTAVITNAERAPDSLAPHPPGPDAAGTRIVAGDRAGLTMGAAS